MPGLRIQIGGDGKMRTSVGGGNYPPRRGSLTGTPAERRSSISSQNGGAMRRSSLDSGNGGGYYPPRRGSLTGAPVERRSSIGSQNGGATRRSSLDSGNGSYYNGMSTRRLSSGGSISSTRRRSSIGNGASERRSSLGSVPERRSSIGSGSGRRSSLGGDVDRYYGQGVGTRPSGVTVSRRGSNESFSANLLSRRGSNDPILDSYSQRSSSSREEKKLEKKTISLMKLIWDEEWNECRMRIKLSPEDCAVKHKKTGDYPIHYAVGKKAPLDIIVMIIEAFPHGPMMSASWGLPLHCAIGVGSDYDVVKIIYENFPEAKYAKNAEGHLPANIAQKSYKGEERESILELLGASSDDARTTSCQKDSHTDDDVGDLELPTGRRSGSSRLEVNDDDDESEEEESKLFKLKLLEIAEDIVAKHGIDEDTSTEELQRISEDLLTLFESDILSPEEEDLVRQALEIIDEWEDEDEEGPTIPAVNTGGDNHQAGDGICLLCQQVSANVIVNPCNHLALCTKCSEIAGKCPQCKVAIRRLSVL